MNSAWQLPISGATVSPAHQARALVPAHEKDECACARRLRAAVQSGFRARRAKAQALSHLQAQGAHMTLTPFEIEIGAQCISAVIALCLLLALFA